MIAALADGLLSPLFVPAHAMMLIALGLLTGQQPRRLPHFCACVAGLAAGSITVAAAYASIYSGAAVYALTAICGLVVAAAVPMPTVLGLLLALCVGFALAFDSPPEVFSISKAIAMQFGTVLAAAIYLAAIAGIAAVLTNDWQRIGIRIVGSWFAASAILVLALQLLR